MFQRGDGGGGGYSDIFPMRKVVFDEAFYVYFLSTIRLIHTSTIVKI